MDIPSTAVAAVAGAVVAVTTTLVMDRVLKQNLKLDRMIEQQVAYNNGHIQGCKDGYERYSSSLFSTLCPRNSARGKPQIRAPQGLWFLHSL